MTRLAVLADIHGNLAAFEAAVRHASLQGVDQMILAGDIINGSPDSRDCWSLALSLGCPILRGNHERYAADFGTSRASPLWSKEQFGPLQWAVAQLSHQDRQSMESLPLHWRYPQAPDLLIVHASERDDHDSIAAHTPEPLLHAMFPVAQERFIIRAHNHCGQVRIWQNGIILTCGSVGLPLDGHPSAQYLLLEQVKDSWKFSHQSAPYPLEATIKRFRDTGYLSKVGPMARLFFREVVTASHQIVPFLRFYAQWSQEEEISLAQAVDRFLSM